MRPKLLIGCLFSGAGAGAALLVIDAHWRNSVPFWAMAIVLGAAVLPGGAISRWADWKAIPITMLGIAVGVVIGSGYETSVTRIDQNLWPFTIAIFCVLGAVPMAVAFGLGGFIWKKTRDRSSGGSS